MDKENKLLVGKKAFKAGTWYVISSVLLKTISIITTPIFTTLLTVEEYGVTSTFNTWYTLLLPFCTLNLAYSIERAKQDYEDKFCEYVGSMQLLSLVVAGSIGLIAILLVNPLSTIMVLPNDGVIWLFIYLFFSPTIMFAQSEYRFKYSYRENIWIAWYISLATVFLSLLFIMLLDGNHYSHRIAGIVVPTILLSLWMLVNKFKKGYLCVNKEFWKYGLSLSTPLIIHILSMNMLYQADRIFIAKECGTYFTGIYSLVYNYSVLLSVIISAINEGWLPWFHDMYKLRRYDEINKNIKWIVVFGCYIAMACISFAPEAINLLGGEQYMEGIYCVPPIILGIVAQFIYTHYVNIEMHLKKTKYVAIGTVVAASINVILNILFIPSYGYIAAAYTTLISYIFLMIIHYWITRVKLKVKLYNDSFMFGALFITMLVAGGISILYEHRLVRYLIILLGFLSMLYVFRKYLVDYFVKFIKT